MSRISRCFLWILVGPCKSRFEICHCQITLIHKRRNTGTTRSPKKNQAFISSAKSISVRVFYPIDDEIVQGTDLLEQHRFDFNWEFIENMFKRIPKLFMTQLKLVQLKSFRLTGKTGTKKSPRSSGVVIDNSCEKTRDIDMIPVRDQKESRQYPVVIVTQDYNGIEVNALDGLCEKLAKKEMIVVAVKHGKHENSPWNHFNVPFVSMDSKDAPMDSSNHELLENRLESRSEEIVQILDHLLAIHYGQNPYSFYHNDHEAAGREEMATALFKNRLNLENLIVLGHSFSAGIALQSANIDRRVKMVVCVDAWLQPVCNDLIECGTPCPLLLLQSGPKFFVDTTHQLNESNNDERAKHIVAHSPGSYLFRLKDMNHFALLDVMQLLPTWIMKLSGYSGRRLFKRLDTKEHVDIQEVVATFVDAVLKKDIHMGGKGRTSMHWSKFGFDYRTTSSSSSSAASASSRPMYPKNPSSSGNAEDWWDRLLTGERLFSDISVERFGW